MPAGPGLAGAARDRLGLALTRAQAFPDPEVLGFDLDRALDHPNQIGVQALKPVTRQLAETMPLDATPSGR
jgi:hypothetical protein